MNNIVRLLFLLSILFWVGCEDKKDDTPVGDNNNNNTNQSPGFIDGLPIGSFQVTNIIGYSNQETCEGELTHMCLVTYDGGENLKISSFPPDDEYDNQDDCEANGHQWLPILDVETEGEDPQYYIFGADSTFIHPEWCNSYPYSLDGNSITTGEGSCDGESLDSIKEEDLCLSSGGIWEPHSGTGTLNDDGTITLVYSEPAECEKIEGEADTEEECNALEGDWESAQCGAIVLTYSETHDGSCTHNSCVTSDDCDEGYYCNADDECQENSSEGI